ncbi:Amino acid/polyamine transporter I [Artemisia annua]|uniref:Amino acid/polyamine transporter I n=1 Tax=Artemisia annua TaxID=35608 RepID=A0A2U1KQ64_ARTAN|nr:Amino acid/polyamine transporter I [Artemisia annua]
MTGEEAGPYHRLRDTAAASNEITRTGHDDSKLNELGYKQELNRSLSKEECVVTPHQSERGS